MGSRDHACPQCGRGGMNEPRCPTCDQLRVALERTKAANGIQRRACGPCQSPECPHVAQNAELRAWAAREQATQIHVTKVSLHPAGTHPPSTCGLAVRWVGNSTIAPRGAGDSDEKE